MNLKKNTNEQAKPTKNKHTDTGNKADVARGEGVGVGRMKWVKDHLFSGMETFLGGEQAIGCTEVEIECGTLETWIM